MALIPTIHKVDNACATDVPCTLINLSSEDIYLYKGEMLWLLIETDIELNKISTKTKYNVPCHDQDQYAQIMCKKKETISLGNNVITSPADIDTNRKVKLQDAKLSEHQNKNLRNCFKSAIMVSPLINQILTETN